MDFANDVNKIKELLETAQDVLIVTHERPTADSMGSTLALYLGLTGLGKRVSVACPDPMIVEHSNFVGANKVVSTLGKKNFVISLDYVDGSIEKVSYNIEGDKFNLVIEPRPGFEVFNQDKVHYSYAGSNAQVIFTVDTIHLGGLKKLFDEDKDLYASKPIINIDRHPNNAQYGHTNMVDPQASATAEVVAHLLNGLGVALTADIATNLLNAVYGATNSFQNANVSAGSFELAAAAVKAGGKRFAAAIVHEEAPVKEEVKAPVHEETVIQPTQAQESHEAGHGAPATKPSKAPPEWLKPKIFKSSNLS